MDADLEPLSTPAQSTTGSSPSVDPQRVAPLGSLHRRRFGLRSPGRTLLERYRWVGVVGACFAVAIMLLSNIPLNPNRSSSRVSADSASAPSSVNATGYFPYLLNATDLPLPSPFLNSTAGASLPQLAQGSLDAITVFELAYLQTSFSGTNNLSFDSGTYNTTLAVQGYTRSSCGGPCPRLPILWGAPTVVAQFGTNNVTADAIAAAGAGVVLAAAFGTNPKTTVWISDDYGAPGTWTNLTAPHGMLLGGSPRLALIPCGLIVTTIATGAMYVSTFPFECHYTANSPNSGGNSGGGRQSPSPPIPTVTGVTPNYGALRTVVNVTGTNFFNGAVANFGGTAALATAVLSPTWIQATVPSGSGTVHVTVTSGGYTSNQTCGDLFSYGNYAGAPTISTVSPAIGPPGQLVTLTGSGFTSGALGPVLFGGVPSPQIVRVTPTQLQVVAPAGNGTVYVTATVNGKTSLSSCGTEYTFNPGNPPPNSATFPPAIAAYPAWITGGSGPEVGILASNTSNSEIVFYNSSDDGKTFRSSNVEPFNNSLGSAIFGQVGGTRLVVAAGQSGQVAFAAEGPQLFGLFTSRVQGRMAVETVASTDGGRTWTGPYLTASYAGALADPEAATSPAGYAYATWRENGAGAWQVDEAIFSFDGKALVLPQTIPGSGGASNPPAGPPTLAVDGFQRPLYVWSAWNNSTGSNELRATGGFLSPQVATQTLRSAWNATIAPDFLPMSSGALGFYKANVNGTIVGLQTAIGSPSPSRLCWAWTNFSRDVYPNVTSADPVPFLAAPGSSVSGCLSTPSPGTDVSQVAPIEGPFAADTYLYVYSDWISESLGYGTLPAPNWAGSPLVGNVTVVVPPRAGPKGIPFVLSLPNGTSDTQGDTASVNPITINPNTVWLNATDHPVSRSTNGIYKESLPGGGWKGCGGWNQSDSLHSVSVTLTVIPVGGPKIVQTYTNPFRIPNLWVTNLSAQENGSWWENVSLTFQEWKKSVNTCMPGFNSSGPIPITPTWPNDSVVRLNGSFTTGLSFDPWTPTLPLTVQTFPDPKNGSLADDSIHWNNTIWANATAWNNESYCGIGCTPYTNQSQNLSYQTPENLGFKPQPDNNQYFQVYAVIQSHHGGYTGAWPTTLSSGQVINASNPLVTTASCSYYQTANPIHIGLPTEPVTDLTDTSATVTWLSDQNGSGWMNYNDTWEATFSTTAIEHASGNATYPYAYTVELRGLRPWGVYQATLGVGSYAGCLEYMNDTHVEFQTLTQAALFEYDYPYDSITQQGGGAAIEWQEPAGFQAIANYTNGSLSYYPTGNPSDVVTIPLPSLWFVEDDGPLGTTMGINATGLTTNTVYVVSLDLNYTVRPPGGKGAWLPLWVGSKPFSFWYEKDTSGDGLTDWEKLRGWEVTAQHADGSWFTGWVTANPSLYATNGLTSDYQEKLYGLNPTTVDTAGSHMLDTWNLTFDLGPKSQPLRVPVGADFRYWYEAGNLSTDYKWTTECQYYPGPGASCSKTSLGTGWSNITGADSWAWASRVLWSRTALTAFINMSGVHNASWLRATLGNTSTDWTLTVWGKLSWGANPLAASTPLDGIADGARVNPLYDEDLLISGLSSSLSACPSPPGGGAYGWAALFYLNWSTSTGPHELPAGGNFSTAALDSSTGCGSISNYQVPIPVNGTSQNQSLQVRVILNQSSSPTQTVLKAAKIHGTATGVSVAYDTEWGKARRYSFSGSGSTGIVGSLSFTLSVVPAGVKNNTLIWLPTDNGTLNNLPWGLKRYTGEQAFDLVVVNVTTASSLNSYYIPYAQNASDQYRVTLNPGLNNLLIPRGQFLYSPLGQAVLLNENTSWTNASAKPPLLNTNENNTINGYGSSNPLKNLACYWQNRAVNDNASGISGAICSTETGTAMGNSKGLVVVAATSASGMNSGGVPGNPSLETGAQAGAALQSVLTLNLSAQTGLNLLLAALLDNVTGGVNGTFLPVTYLIPSLGLNSVVTEELANASYTSSGLFGVPWGIVPPPPPPPPCNSLWCYATNLVSGIITVGSVFFSYVWSGVTAVAQFINDHLPTWLKNLGAQIAQRTASSLSAIGATLASAFSSLMTYVISLATSQLSAVITPVNQPAGQSAGGVHDDLVTATNDVNSGQPNAAKSVEPDLNSQVVHTLLTLVLVAGIALVVTAVLSILTGNIAAILAGIIIGLIVGLTFAVLDVQSHGTISLGTLVWWADGFRNCTSTNTLAFSCSPGSSAQQADQPIWDGAHVILADPNAVALMWTLLTVVIGAVSGAYALAVAFGLALFGVYLTLWGSNNPAQRSYTDIFTSIVDFASLYSDVQALRDPKTIATPGGRIIAGATLGIDIGTLVTDAYS
jgi:IPT/TIG domain